MYESKKIAFILAQSISIIAAVGTAIFFLWALICSIYGTDDFTGWEKMIIAQRDSFYVGGGTDYYNHIPLIYPYYVEQRKDAILWSIDLKFMLDKEKGDLLEYYYQINEVDKFAVEKDVIMAYSSFTRLPEMNTHWFVIIPSRNIEAGFEKEEDFLIYIQRLDIQNPRWITPYKAIHQFWETGCLYWIPDCK